MNLYSGPSTDFSPLVSGPKVVESQESVVINRGRTDSGAADVDERKPR
jgi:hypothetical protein